MTQPHPFDRALALEPVGPRAGDFAGTTSPDYWNMVGPFGGMTAALLLQAVMRHPDLLGAPIALTVNYAAPIEAGAFEIHARPARTNRSTQHWTVELSQPNASGAPQVTTTATLVTAVRRETWGATDLAMPRVTGVEGMPAMKAGGLAGVAWFDRYDIRPVSGAMPAQWDGREDRGQTCVWLRDAVARPLDFPALAALSDMFYPRIWLRRAKLVPAGTVSITTYFHADAAQLAEVGTAHVLGRAVGQQFRNGFFDQAAQLWSASGALLATSNQIVYYKE